MSETRTLYKAGIWWVEARPVPGAVKISVSKAGMGWRLGDYSFYMPSRYGYLRPHFWQRSVDRALRWGIAYADKMHRREQEGAWAMEQAERAVEGLSARADALATLEAELAR